MDLPTTPQQLGATAAMAWAWAVDFLPRLGGSLVILVVGLILAKWAGRAMQSIEPRGVRLDPTIRPVIAASVRYAIGILVVVAALGQLGVQTASILAVLGAAGLAIGLALQGTLSNIAAGLMLLWLRPFRVGEYIEAPNVSGIVREIGLFVTKLDTFDGLYRFVPNSVIWNQPLLNHNRHGGRMANISVAIPLDADVDKARGVIAGVLKLDGRVRHEPAQEIFLDAMTDNFVWLGIRMWLPAAGFWAIHRALAEEIRQQLNAAGITVQRFTHPTPDVGDAANLDTGEAPGNGESASAASRRGGRKRGRDT